MKIPTNIKIEDMTQKDLDAVVAAYNRLDASFTFGHKFCFSIIQKGLGVDSTDIRFHDRMLAHEIMRAFDPIIEDEQ